MEFLRNLSQIFSNADRGIENLHCLFKISWTADALQGIVEAIIKHGVLFSRMKLAIDNTVLNEWAKDLICPILKGVLNGSIFLDT